MSHIRRDFSKNLRYLCERYRSITDVSRSIGVNRQQFNKYLTGPTIPSPRTMARICAFFDVDEQLIQLPHRQFMNHMDRRQNSQTEPHGPIPKVPSTGSYTDDIDDDLQRYCGFHFNYYLSPLYAGVVLRGLGQIYRESGLTRSKYITKFTSFIGAKKHNFYMRREGIVSKQGDKIFFIDVNGGRVTTFSFDVVFDSQKSPYDVVGGICIGVTPRLLNQIYGSRVVYQYLGTDSPPASVAKLCGRTDLQDPTVPQVVRDMLTAENPDLDSPLILSRPQ